MCGIVGFWQADIGPREELETIIDSMSCQLKHRGPDSFGRWIDTDRGIALGHRRLSIVDLSPAGHQPMVSECGRWVISFNGEIYNHMEIRAQLKRGGQAPGWRGHSDTETFLAAISEWGVDNAIKAVVGMFAFALWDKVEHSLILARDRMGEKPLYYGWQGDTFMFASELKAMYCHPQFKGNIDPLVAGSFFANNYIPAPLCIYQGLYKLPPASIVRFNILELRKKAVGNPVRYWSLPLIAHESGSRRRISLEENIDELEVLLRSVLKDQMLADVPLGAFLSGGIDSSLIVALMQSMSNRPIKTFSIGMPDVKLDESKYAAAVATHIGTEHFSHTISSNEALELIPKIQDVWDEPFADSSQIPTLLVSHFARKHVTVALSGDGADELFLGYRRYRTLRNLWRYRMPARLPFKISSKFLAGRKLPGVGHLTPRIIESVGALLYSQSKEDLIGKYYDRYRSESNPMMASSVGCHTRTYFDLREYVAPRDLALYGALRDQMEYLPDNIMAKVDRASMSASLETRAPFLDHRIVEYAWKLPLQHKLSGNTTKLALRRLLYRHVPQELMERPKQGFSIPISKWLRRELYEWADSLLQPQDLEACGLNANQIRQYWTEHMNGKNHSARLWAVLMLRAFIENKHVNT